MAQLNIYQKLIEVRKSVPYLQKDTTGPQYQYVGSSQVLASLKAKMDELGLLLIPKVVSHNVTESVIEFIEKYGNSEKPKRTITYFTELDMVMMWVNAEKPEEVIECPWYGQGVDTAGEKGVGKALTYAEKYFMLKFFNIPTDKDDPDSFQAKHDDKPREEQPPKYEHTKQEPPKQEMKTDEIHHCEGDTCKGKNKVITDKIAKFSKDKFGKKLCYSCQESAKKREAV